MKRLTIEGMIRSHLKKRLLGSAGGVGVAAAPPRGSGTLVRVTERGGAGDAPTTGPGGLGLASQRIHFQIRVHYTLAG